MSPCPRAQNKDSENLFFQIERKKKNIQSMSPCPRAQNKDSENLFFSNRKKDEKYSINVPMSSS
jgi:hypothetical protein